MFTNPPSSAAEAVVRVTQSAQTAVENGLYRLSFRAMSSPCQIKVHGVGAPVVRDFFRDAVNWVANFEARYSRFIPDSLIGKINAAAGTHWVDTDPETDRLFQLCHELFFFTRGSFDPSALPLIQLWNWKQQPPRVPDAEAIRAARELVGWNKIQRRPGGIFLPLRGMALDLGGVGKEYAVDNVMNLALQRGIQNVLIDFGQDVRARGHAPEKTFWWIGLDDAQTPGKCWAGVALTDQAVATSGDYLRHFVFNGVRYGHILDPRTGYPALNDVRAASIISPSCTIAGLLSTSICILGAKEGMELIELHPGAAGAITTNVTRIYSRKFRDFLPA
ncbi:MAG TPA: FAD:protein FMN transferase [Candidatus Sulfotelmatobacter sp.]|jgi:thiamine biosynthesis lipoprotein|nr:FAD:protein FMN transferase [Candidatus Sulfotelmatobacter sp.]